MSDVPAGIIIIGVHLLTEPLLDAMFKREAVNPPILTNRSATWGKTQFWFVLTLFLLVWITNEHFSLVESTDEMGHIGIHKYVALSRGSPAEWRAVPFHDAQRFMLPALIGFASRSLNIGLDNAYAAFALFFLLGTVIVTARVLVCLKVSKRVQQLTLFLVVFNPYLIRYYTAFPGEVTHAAFNHGVSLVILGLVEKRVALIISGITLASATRQVTFLLLPPLWVWLWSSAGWLNQSRRERYAVAGVSTAIVISLYALTSWILDGSILGLKNLAVAKSPFFLHGPFVPAFALRCALPYVLAIAMGAGSYLAARHRARPPLEFHLLLFFFVSISIQVILAGLIDPVGSPIRHALPGLIPLILASALCLQEMGLGQGRWQWPHTIICLAVFVGSFHHLSSIIYTLRISNIQFGLLHLGSAIAAFFASYSACRSE